jgi:hypothetical protein
MKEINNESLFDHAVREHRHGRSAWALANRLTLAITGPNGREIDALTRRDGAA